MTKRFKTFILEEYTSSDGVTPMTAREKYAEYQEQDALKVEKKKVRERMEIDALRKTTSNDAYRNASEEERSKMLNTSLELRDIGDNPSTPGRTKAEYSVAHDIRGENIGRDTRAKLKAMSPEERQAEFNRVIKQHDDRREKSYQRGKKAAHGGKLSSMDDVRAMKDFFAQNREQYRKAIHPIFSQSARDNASEEKYEKNRTPAQLEKLKKGELRGMKFDLENPTQSTKLNDAEVRDRREFVMQDQGVDITDRAALEKERVRRAVLAGQLTVDMDNLGRRSGYGSTAKASAARRAASPRAKLSPGRSINPLDVHGMGSKQSRKEDTP